MTWVHQLLSRIKCGDCQHKGFYKIHVTKGSSFKGYVCIMICCYCRNKVYGYGHDEKDAILDAFDKMIKKTQ